MYNFHGQSNQDEFIFNRFFRNIKNGISIECGSFDGVIESSTLFFEENLGWTCINIEASPPIFKSLMSNRNKAINLNIGLGEKKTVSKFNHVIHPRYGINFGNGSFEHKINHKNNLTNEGCTFEEYDVKIDRYDCVIDELMEKSFPNKNIDLFVLDVEGYELQVIEGMKNSKYLPLVFCIEYPFVGLDNIKQSTIELGYQFDITEKNNVYFIKK